MLNHLISLSELATAAAENSNDHMTALEKLGLGFSVTIIGMAIVFVGLILLIFITLLYPKFVKAVFPKVAAAKERSKAKRDEKRMAKAQKKEQNKVAIRDSYKDVKTSKTEPKEDSVNAMVSETTETDPTLIAVITAAIAASLGTSSNGIVIRSLRRANSATPAWGASNRAEQVNNRL
jgi:sodium pump decarboxylase gamma subunit